MKARFLCRSAKNDFTSLWIHLTHWGRVTHICVSDLTSIGSDNGLSPGRRQAIIRNNAGILLIRPLGTNFSELLVEILIFSFKKMRLKVSSAKRRPFCLGLNEFKSVMLFRRAQGNEYKSMALIEAQTCVVHINKGIHRINSLRPRLNRRPFADDIFKSIFLNENVWISIKISLKFVPKGPINNIPALVQRMAWRRPGDKPLSEPMMINSPTHICFSRPQWVNRNMESELWINIFGMHNKITVDIYITRT